MLTREMQAKKARYIKEKARKEVGACYEDIKRKNHDVLMEILLAENEDLTENLIGFDEIIKKMENPWFAVSAFIYEMWSHEYSYMENNCDVLQVFSKEAIQHKHYDDWDYAAYLKEMNKGEWIKPYKVARKIYMGIYY